MNNTKERDYDFATNEFELDQASYTVHMNNEDPLDLQYELIARKIGSLDYGTVFGYYDGSQTLLDYKYDFYNNTIEGDVQDTPLIGILAEEILPVVVNQIDNPDYNKVTFYIKCERDNTLPRPDDGDDVDYLSALATLDPD